MTLHLTQLFFFSSSCFSSTPSGPLGPCHLPFFLPLASLPAAFPPSLCSRPANAPERKRPSSHRLASHPREHASLPPHPKPRLLLHGDGTFHFSESAGMKRPGSRPSVASAQTPRAPSRQRVGHVTSRRTASSFRERCEELSRAWPRGAPPHPPVAIRESKISPCLQVCIWGRWEDPEAGFSGKNENCLSEARWDVSHLLRMSVKEHKMGHRTLLRK